jgi:fermentation-respiration switch protein FrsA (DUF1100 family)
MFFLTNFVNNHVSSWVFYVLSVVGVVGLTGAGALYTFQNQLIYPASFPEGSRTKVAKPSAYEMPFEEVFLTTPDKLKLHAYVIMRDGTEDSKNALTIVFLHANAGNMGHRLPIAEVFYRKFKCNVIMLSYRGYGLSEGSPSEKGMKIDAQAALNYVKKHPKLKSTKLVAYGQSIGGAVAINLVATNEEAFSGLILENTFLSIPKLIPSVLPALRHVSFLCHQHWDSETAIARIQDTPTLLLSGALDELVPPSHMAELREIIERKNRGRVVWKLLKEGRHNDTSQKDGYFSTIAEFLDSEVRGGWGKGRRLRDD